MNDQIAESARERTGPEASPHELEGALGRLYDAGGHLVPTRLERDPQDPDRLRKIPTRTEWQIRRMKPETALAHLDRPPDRPRVIRYGLGIIPGSLHSCVADLDVGERREFWASYGEPWGWQETPRGSHSFYDASGEEVTRRPFRIGPFRGELIEARQFVQFHGERQIIRLADDLPRRGSAELQLELFDLAGIEAPAKRRSRHTAKHRSAALIPCPGPLEAATEAARNRHATLFWHWRHWAYREPRGDSYAMWERRVAVYGSGLWIVMPERRLPRVEVDRMGRDIAAWVWDLPPLDRRWVAQFFRGVKREYGRVSHATVAALWERNRAIVEGVEGGLSRRSVAREVGLSRPTVRGVLAAAETWLSPDAKREALAAIWGPHNPPSGGGGSSL